MRMAIIGGGISGLTAAYLLNKRYDVTLFEAEDCLGGHTATKTIVHEGVSYDVDTGFIVFNDWTYPNFIKLLQTLGVASKATEMGFSVFRSDGSYYYAGTNLNTLFAKRRLLFSAQHWSVIGDILRFNREAVADWQRGSIPAELTLAEYLRQNNYSRAFGELYLVPMGSAIWSSSQAALNQFSASFFIGFFHNHGLLSITNRPVWRVIEGGSKQYIEPLTRAFSGGVRVGEPVNSVVRDGKACRVNTLRGAYEFDHVVFACHSDQALGMLHQPSLLERELLGAMPYQTNSVVLHHDARWLPPRRRAWASWNYCLDGDAGKPPVVTYNMNILQGIKADVTFCVTLNETQGIDPDKVFGRYQYAHPVFSTASLAAQSRWAEINTEQLSFCGAYWFNGFHEDGVRSAIRVAERLGVSF